jgi:signal transduction histidine kinase
MQKSKAVAVGGMVFWLACTSPALLSIHRGQLTGTDAATWWVAFLSFGAILIYDNFFMPVRLASPRATRIVFASLLVFGFAMVMVSNDVVMYASSITLVLAAQRLPKFLSPLQSYLGAAAIEIALVVLLAFKEPWLAILGNGGAVAASLLFVVTFGVQERREAAARTALALANAELVATREQLAQSTRTEERLRIARDLHDTLGHHLTALSIQLDVATRRAESTSAEHIREAHAIARLLLSDVRAVVGELRSGGDLDLGARMKLLCRDYGDLTVHPDIPDRLRPMRADRAEVLLRCAQEAITNTLKHAQAKTLRVHIVQTNSATVLRMRDDGRGTNQVNAGHGLTGMRERVEALGGRVELASDAGSGFSISILVPLEEQS